MLSRIDILDTRNQSVTPIRRVRQWEGELTQQSRPQCRHILPLPLQRLNPEPDPFHFSNPQLRLLRPRLLATPREMLNTPGIWVRRPIIRIDRVQHLRRRRALADLGVVAGHGGGGVGDGLVGPGALDVPVLWGERRRTSCVRGVIIFRVFFWTGGGDAERPGEGSCWPHGGGRPHKAVDETWC